jgi:nucleotide-binding universal stress UspA family protein
MFRRILVPLDGSELSEACLAYAEQLSTAFDSEIVLLHVRGLEQEQYEHMHKLYLDGLAETVKSNVENARHDGLKLKIETRVERGDATETICSLVDHDSIDLIVMTAVSTSGLKIGRMIGTVTDQVCRTVPIPVLLIRPKNVQHIDKKTRLINQILIPIDGSELSKLALPIGEELTSKLNISTTLFQMATMVHYYDNGLGQVAFIDYTEINEAEKRRVTTEMTSLEKELKERGLDIKSIVTSGFDAASEIIELGKKINADLVVMSTHGRTGFGRWVFGNIAEKIFRHGEIPLLLVHASAR